MKFQLWNMVLVLALMLGSVVVAPDPAQAQEGQIQLYLPLAHGEQSAEQLTSTGDQSSDTVTHSEDISINAASLSTLGRTSILESRSISRAESDCHLPLTGLLVCRCWVQTSC